MISENHDSERVYIGERIMFGIALICFSAIVFIMASTAKAQDLRFVVFSNGKHGCIDQMGSVVVPINLHQTYVSGQEILPPGF